MSEIFWTEKRREKEGVLENGLQQAIFSTERERSQILKIWENFFLKKLETFTLCAYVLT
jgi:hypothetical protein